MDGQAAAAGRYVCGKNGKNATQNIQYRTTVDIQSRLLCRPGLWAEKFLEDINKNNF